VCDTIQEASEGTKTIGQEANNLNIGNYGKDWLLIVDQIDYNKAGAARINVEYGFTGGTTTALPNGIGINLGGEQSDWACYEMIVFDRALSLNEIRTVEKALIEKYSSIPAIASLGAKLNAQIEEAKLQEKVLTARRTLVKAQDNIIKSYQPYSWFDSYSADISSGTWKDLSGNNRNASINDKVVIDKNSTPWFIKGGTDAKVNITGNAWVPNGTTYTLFHICKYNGGNRGRIWNGANWNSNWLSGFWASSVGFHHDSWLSITDSPGNNPPAGTQYTQGIANAGTEWMIVVDQIDVGKRGLARINGNINYAGGSITNPPQGITINGNGEPSDWACFEVIVFNRALDLNEIKSIEKALIAKYVRVPAIAILKESTISGYLKSNIGDLVKGGYLNRVTHDEFKLKNELPYWKLIINVNSNDYRGAWQSVVGNMYNSGVSGYGWGLWISPEGIVHFAQSGGAVNLYDLGALQNGVPYKIEITFENNIFNFKLTNLSNNEVKEQKLTKTSPLTTNSGFVTIGGGWENGDAASRERFKGLINDIQVITDKNDTTVLPEAKIPQKFYLQLGNIDWSKNIKTGANSTRYNQNWNPDAQWYQNLAHPNKIMAQFLYFAEYYLNRLGLNRGSVDIYSPNNKGKFTFEYKGDGNYTGQFNGETFNWNSRKAGMTTGGESAGIGDNPDLTPSNERKVYEPLPDPVSYVMVPGDVKDSYTCEGAAGYDTSSPGFCVFNDEQSAQDYCSDDKRCKGYVRSDSGKYQVTSNPSKGYKPNYNKQIFKFANYDIPIPFYGPYFEKKDYGTDWACVEGINYPVKLDITGNVVCASQDGQKCMDSADCSSVLKNMSKTTKTVKCTESDYGKDGNWCNDAFYALYDVTKTPVPPGSKKPEKTKNVTVNLPSGGFKPKTQLPVQKDIITFERKDNYNRIFGRVDAPTADGRNVIHLGKFQSYNECEKFAKNHPRYDEIEAITWTDGTQGAWANTCFAVFDKNTGRNENNVISGDKVKRTASVEPTAADMAIECSDISNFRLNAQGGYECVESSFGRID